MRNAVLSSAALVLASGGIVALGNPASAACISNTHVAAYVPSDSDKFNASTACDGAWAGRVGDYIEVRGWYNDGSWKVSSYGWTFIGGGGGGKIIGNTVPGRLLRTEGRYSTYQIGVTY